MIPQRKKRVRMNVRESSVIRCPGHMKYVRGFSCSIENKNDHVCVGRMEAHHVREGSNGGVGLKPDDSTCVPLCGRAHQLGHSIGWQTFETRYQVDLKSIAKRLWLHSPHRAKYLKSITQG